MHVVRRIALYYSRTCANTQLYYAQQAFEIASTTLVVQIETMHVKHNLQTTLCVDQAAKDVRRILVMPWIEKKRDRMTKMWMQTKRCMLNK